MDLQNGNGNSKHFDMTNYEFDSSNQGTCSIECWQELDQFKGRGPRSSTTYSSDSLMMSQLRGYDSNRIPPSVFGTRPSNPAEWSVASNESLFSIHIANGSLSRENFLMLYKSGELGRLDDPIKPVKPEDQAELPKSDAHASSHFHPSLPPVTEDMVTEAKAASEDNCQAANLRTPSRSAESVNCTKSFAFPVFECDEATTKSINMKITKAGSEKQQKATSDSQEQKPQDKEPESEIEQQQPKTPETSPKAGSSSSWFSCFPCLSLCGGK